MKMKTGILVLGIGTSLIRCWLSYNLDLDPNSF